MLEPACQGLHASNELDADAVRLHSAMLDDRRRTTAFIDAVSRTVRPGDVVLEIGTGTGVLAVAAARAGARRVYAVEAANMAAWASQIFDANGVSDRVVLVRGWSDEISLPEPANVLIAELVGDDPLGEGIIETTGDALRRQLVPGARLVPSGLAIYCYPVSIPADALAARVVRDDRLRTWRRWYGIDFGPLANAWGGERFVDFVDPRQARDWQALGRPHLVAAFDLGALTQRRSRWSGTLAVTRQGRLDGLLFYCRLFCGRRGFLSTSPAAVGEDNHWFTPLRIMHTPVEVRPGDRLDVRYWRAPRTGQPMSSVRIRPRMHWNGSSTERTVPDGRDERRTGPRRARSRAASGAH